MAPWTSASGAVSPSGRAGSRPRQPSPTSVGGAANASLERDSFLFVKRERKREIQLDVVHSGRVF